MLLAVLSPILKCDWDLAPWQQAMLTSVSGNLQLFQYCTHQIMLFDRLYSLGS